MTARDEILAALPRMRARHGRDYFSPAEVIQELRRNGSVYSDSTIRTHVVSRMCGNSPNHHAVAYNDLERIGHGLYRQRHSGPLGGGEQLITQLLTEDGLMQTEWLYESPLEAPLGRTPCSPLRMWRTSSRSSRRSTPTPGRP